MTLIRPHLGVHPHVRMNYRVFTVLSLVALPLLALGGLVVFGIGQAQSRETYGVHLEQLAERTAAAVDTFVMRRVIDVSELARVPDVREAAAAGGRVPFNLEAARTIDEQWQRQQAPPAVVENVLGNAASRFFRDVAQNDTIYSELLLTDVKGRLVAASNVTSDFLQADEDWWRDTFSRGGPHISDAKWDESARTYAIEIAVPVFAPGSPDVAGVLKAVTNSREMLAVISGVRFGQTGQAVLVRKDGSLVVARQAVQPETRFFAAPLLREALGLTLTSVSGPPASSTDRATDPEFRTYFSAQTPDGGRAIVAVAPTQLGISYPDLPWVVAVYQAEEELFAPVRAQIWNFLIMQILVVVAMLVLALWFSMRLAAFPVDVDMHLVKHARVHRIDEDEDEEADGEEPEKVTVPPAPGTVVP